MNLPSVFAVQFYCNGTTEHNIDVQKVKRLAWQPDPRQKMARATGICRNEVRKSYFSPASIPQIILSGYILLSQLSPLSTCQSSKVSSVMSDVPANNFLSSKYEDIKTE